MQTKRAYTVFNVLKSAYTLYSGHDTSTLGAALSYYMIFSMAPVIIIVVAITGAVLGPHAVQGEIKDQLQDFLGTAGALQVENLIKSVYHPGKNLLTAFIAISLLIYGAISVFGQIRTSLNTIWEVKPHAKQPAVKFFLDRLFSFGMIICLALLLLVSLVVNAALTAFTDFLNAHFSGLSVWILSIVHHALSLLASTILFAFVYKYLSDARLKWAMVWEGALFTAVLFGVGKHLISFYIGKVHIASTYGAIGSAVVILAWVYYSSQIVFFGAQFTRALACTGAIRSILWPWNRTRKPVRGHKA